jgi:hypothetical protein
MKKRPDKTRAGTIPIVYLPDRNRWQLTIYANASQQ